MTSASIKNRISDPDISAPALRARPGPLFAGSLSTRAPIFSAIRHEPSPSPSATTMISSPVSIAANADDKHFANFSPPPQTGMITEHLSEVFASGRRSAGVSGGKGDAAVLSSWLFISGYGAVDCRMPPPVFKEKEPGDPRKQNAWRRAINLDPPGAELLVWLKNSQAKRDWFNRGLP